MYVSLTRKYWIDKPYIPFRPKSLLWSGFLNSTGMKLVSTQNLSLSYFIFLFFLALFLIRIILFNFLTLVIVPSGSDNDMIIILQFLFTLNILSSLQARWHNLCYRSNVLYSIVGGNSDTDFIVFQFSILLRANSVEETNKRSQQFSSQVIIYNRVNNMTSIVIDKLVNNPKTDFVYLSICHGFNKIQHKIISYIKKSA